jgi:hypothetical protein
MKRTIHLLLLTCLAFSAIGQQKTLYKSSPLNQVLSEQAVQASFAINMPSGSTRGLPLYRPDSLKNRSPHIARGLNSGLITGTDSLPSNQAQYISYPDSMAFRPFPIWRDMGGVYHAGETALSVRDALEEKGTKYYLDYTNGNNSNSGLSPSKPKKTVASVMTANAGKTAVIYLAPGIYRQDALAVVKASTDTSNIVLIGAGKDKTFVTGGNSTAEVWAATGLGGYSSPIAGTDRVLDAAFLNAYGLISELKYVSTADSVNLIPGSVFYNSTTVYVHTTDSRVPDSNLLVLKSIGNTYSVNGGVFYAQGISFVGGRRALQIYSNPSTGSSTVDAYLYDCNFLYGATGEGLWTYNIRSTWSENCQSAFNRLDGFNYKSVNTPTAQTVVEINCQSFINGFYQNKPQPPYITNASSAHSSIDVVRVNCIGWGNAGPNFIDVSATASEAPLGKKQFILNAGVTAYNSMGRFSSGDSNSGSNDFQAGSFGGRTIMYLYGVTSKSDSAFKAKTGSTIYTDSFSAHKGTLTGNIINGTAPGVVGIYSSRAFYHPTQTIKPNVVITQPATGATLTIADGSSLITAGAFATTITATATSNFTLPTGTNTGYSTKTSSISSTQLATSLTNETGTGAVVFATSPLLVTPQLTAYTVATLPTGKPAGTLAYVTDAIAPTYLGTLTGGGSIITPVFYNGSAWVAH